MASRQAVSGAGLLWISKTAYTRSLCWMLPRDLSGSAVRSEGDYSLDVSWSGSRRSRRFQGRCCSPTFPRLCETCPSLFESGSASPMWSVRAWFAPKGKHFPTLSSIISEWETGMFSQTRENVSPGRVERHVTKDR